MKKATKRAKKETKRAAVKVVQKPNVALIERAQVIKERDIACDETDVRRRREVGVLVKDTIADRTYGESIVANLAAQLQWCSDKVLQYEAVAKAWDDQQFNSLVTRRNSKGDALSWSHFVELAFEEDANKRDAAIEAAFKDALSVRHLAAYMKQREAASSDAATDSPAATAATVTPRKWRVAIEELRAQGQAANANADVWCQHLGTVIDSPAPTTFTPEMRSDVAGIRDDHQRWAAACSARAAQLERYLVTIDESLSNSKSPSSNGTSTNSVKRSHSGRIARSHGKADSIGVLATA